MPTGVMTVSSLCPSGALRTDTKNPRPRELARENYLKENNRRESDYPAGSDSRHRLPFYISLNKRLII